MNLSREIFAVSFYHDMPRSYIFQIRNRTYIRGPYAETVKHFVRILNFKLKLKIFDDVPGTYRIYTDIVCGIFNMSTYSSSYKDISKKYISLSYPLEKNQKCVMVPFSQDLPRYLYILRPFGPYIWLCLIAGIFYIGFLMRYIALAYPTQKFERSIVPNILHAFNITFNTNNHGLNKKQAPIRVLIFYTLLYAYGFIVSAYYLPYLASFCTKPLFMKPIDTVEDILDSKLNIIIKNTSYRELRHSFDRKWPILRHLMVNVSGSDYQMLLWSFNRNYAYVVALDQWDFIDRQQRHLKKPVFHLSQVCFSAALRSLPLQANASYLDKLNIYLMRIQESGLWDHWIEMAFIDAVHNNDAEILLDSHPIEALTLDFFIVGWFVIIVGAAISLVVIITEHIAWKYQLRKR